MHRGLTRRKDAALHSARLATRGLSGMRGLSRGQLTWSDVRQGAWGSSSISSISWHHVCAALAASRACRGRTHVGTLSRPWPVPTWLRSSVMP